MKIISLFNNKGGVGKSTLSYHLGCALGELGKKVLFVDLDPQCNLMYTHNTYPSVAQGLKCAMWKVPEIFSEMRENNPQYLQENQIEFNTGASGKYKETLDAYKAFAEDFITRAEVL